MNRTCALPFGLLAMLCTPSVAHACGDPSERWYTQVSDFVFDGNAVCNLERRTCRVRVTNEMKNPDSLSIEGQVIEVDFQDWYAEWYATHPDEIILICGVPYFEPEKPTFRARFYANFDEKSSQLIVRRARISGRTRENQE